MNDVMTIHEVRTRIKSIYDTLEMLNCHMLDNSIDIYDINNVRIAWEDCRKIMSSKWTNQLM